MEQAISIFHQMNNACTERRILQFGTVPRERQLLVVCFILILGYSLTMTLNK